MEVWNVSFLAQEVGVSGELAGGKFKAEMVAKVDMGSDRYIGVIKILQR